MLLDSTPENDIAERLRLWRKTALELTQKEFAEATGVHLSVSALRRRLAGGDGNRETCAHENVSGHEMVRDEKLARRLVVRRGTSGNCTYDEGAKRELIELCQSGTVSVAKVALTYGINPNLLHNWIALYRKEGTGKLARTVA
jgi:transcriptional regulator with XRE-family HTH domain